MLQSRTQWGQLLTRIGALFLGIGLACADLVKFAVGLIQSSPACTLTLDHPALKHGELVEKFFPFWPSALVWTSFSDAALLEIASLMEEVFLNMLALLLLHFINFLSFLNLVLVLLLLHLLDILLDWWTGFLNSYVFLLFSQTEIFLDGSEAFIMGLSVIEDSLLWFS